MILTVDYSGDAVAVPLSSLHSDIDFFSLRLLILLCSDRTLRDVDASMNEICAVLGCEESDVKKSVVILCGKGILKERKSSGEKPVAGTENEPENSGNIRTKPEKTKQETDTSAPVYSGEQLSELLENEKNGLKELIGEIQKVTGKVLNEAEVGKIASLYDYLGMETEQILMIFMYFKRRFDAEERRISVPYVVKSAYGIWQDGCDTPEKTEKYIRDKEDRSSLENRLRRLFGIGARSWTKKEKEALRLWSEELKMSYEMIEAAYYRNIDSIGTLKINYITKILKNWADGGIYTVDGLGEADAKYQSEKLEDEQLKSSFDTDDFFDKALNKSYVDMKKK